MRLTPIVGRARIGRLDRVERNVDRVIAVAVDLHRQAERLHFGDHLFHLRGVEIRRTLGGRVQIGLGLRAGLGLVGAVADDLDAIEREQRIVDGRAFRAEAEAAPGLRPFMSSNITLALVRQASVFESLANGSIQSERIVPGSCKHRVADGGDDMPNEVRDRLGRDFGRDLGEEMDREFEHRAFLVDHAVELAVGAAAEMAAARQIADILADAGDLESLAVDAGVVQIDVPDEDRVIARNRVEFVRA